MDSQVDPNINLDNMGSLGGMLAERGYESAQLSVVADPSDPLGERIARPDELAGAQPAQPIPGAVAPGAAPPPGQGFAPPPRQPAQPAISAQQYQAALYAAQQARQAAEQAVRDKLEADDRAFLHELDSRTDQYGNPLSDEQKNVLILLRHNEQLQQANQHAFQAMQQREQREEFEEQMAAKHALGLILAEKAGLPFENPGIQRAILSAETRLEMEQIITSLRATIPTRQAVQAKQQVATGAFAAPGSAQGGVRQPAGPKPGSGDLQGLLRSRPYVVGQY